MNNKPFHGNRINQIRQTLVQLHRQEAKHLSLLDFTKKMGYHQKLAHVDVLGQKVHLLLENDHLVYPKGIAETQDGPLLLMAQVYFKQLTPAELEAITTHEFGHFFYGHTNLDTDPQIEAEADEYCASIVGFEPLISALEKMQKVLHENKLVHLRIEHLKKLQSEFKMAA